MGVLEGPVAALLVLVQASHLATQVSLFFPIPTSIVTLIPLTLPHLHHEGGGELVAARRAGARGVVALQYRAELARLVLQGKH